MDDPPAYRPQPRLLQQHPAVVAAPATSGVVAVRHAGPAPSSALVAHRAGAIALHAGGPSGGAAAADLQLALTSGVLQANLPADQLWAPAAGPSNPRAIKRFVNDGQHTLAGTLEGESLDGTSFEAQYRAFMAHGVAASPAGAGGLVATAALAPALAAAAGGLAVAAAGRRSDAVPVGMTVHVTKRAREGAGDVADVDSWRGPWAAYAGDAARRSTPLERGELSDAQKRLRVEQGYKPDTAGKLEKDAPTPVITPSGAGAGAGAAPKPAGPSSLPHSTAGDAGRQPGGAAGGASGVKGGQQQQAGTGSAKSGTAALIEAGKGYVPGTAVALHPGAGAGAAREDDSEGAAAAAHADADGSSSSGAAAADLGAGAGAAVGKAGTSSIFHGKEARDYQGRPWCAPPKGVRSDDGDHECFIPKKPLHKYTGACCGLCGACVCVVCVGRVCVGVHGGGWSV